MHLRPTPAVHRLLALLLALALVAAACGNGDEEEAAEADAAADAPADPTPTPAPDEPPPAEPDEAAEEPDEAADAAEAPEMVRIEGVTTAEEYVDDFGEESLEQWQEAVPGIEDVRIPSSVDDYEQPALWLPPEGEGAQPLLLVFHTWSTPYRQTLDIPFGQWAQEMGWGMIHPDFRGANDNPEATGSDLAVQDSIDAVDWAIEQADIDEDRVYAIGFSGGGMMALLMAGRHPERFAGTAAWTPNHDLVDWYVHHVEQGDDQYPAQIEASCGGDPTTDEQAREDCLHRSPAGHLAAAREAGVPVYVAHGLQDDLVPTDHGARAFNEMAAEEDLLDDEAIAALNRNELPEELQDQIEGEHFFTEDEPDVHFVRESGAVTLVLFEGGHDMVYHPALEWMVRGAAAGS